MCVHVHTCFGTPLEVRMDLIINFLTAFLIAPSSQCRCYRAYRECLWEFVGFVTEPRSVSSDCFSVVKEVSWASVCVQLPAPCPSFCNAYINTLIQHFGWSLLVSISKCSWHFLLPSMSPSQCYQVSRWSPVSPQVFTASPVFNTLVLETLVLSQWIYCSAVELGWLRGLLALISHMYFT